MKRLLVLLAVLLGLAAPVGAAKSAEEICDVYCRAATKPNYYGWIPPTTTPMVCRLVIQDQPTALVLNEGYGITDRSILDSLTSWRVQETLWTEVGGFFKREICFPLQLVRGKHELTLCGDENHTSLWPDDVLRLVNHPTIRETFCLLGSNKRCAAALVQLNLK